MAGSSGVFIRCNRNDGRECLNALKRLMKPSEMYSCLQRDDTYSGLKILFKDALTVRSILREQHLWISGKMFPIHSLTTTLIVHTELFDFRQDLEEILRNRMQHIGPTLEVSRLRMFDDMPDSYTGNWKIVLDVPEIEDLDVFCQIGSPNNMRLNLPGFKKRFRVTFCCSFCEEDGHTLRSCPMIGNYQNTSETQAVTQSSHIDSNEAVREPTPIPSSSQRASEFPTRDSDEKINAEKKPAILPDHIKTWARKIGKEKVMQEFISHSSNTSTLITKESDQDPENSRPSKRRTLDENSDGNEYKPSSKYARELDVTRATTPSVCRFDPCPSTSHCGPGGFESPRDASRKNVPHSTELPRSSYQEDTGQVPTSSRSEEVYDPVKSELPSTDDNESDSNQNPPQSSATGHQTHRRRKQTRKTRINIPEGIRIIIRQNSGVLCEERLEAFFNHVKKKSCPCVVARQYTEEVQSFKAQLQGIKDQYYNTPIIHSGDEKEFMKWFENVLTRFDRKPTKKTENTN